jgi:hypothetical protein
MRIGVMNMLHTLAAWVQLFLAVSLPADVLYGRRTR